jgi:hypothetical protein
VDVLKINDLFNGLPRISLEICKAFCQSWIFELGAKTWLFFLGPKIFKRGHLLIDNSNSQFPIYAKVGSEAVNFCVDPNPHGLNTSIGL